MSTWCQYSVNMAAAQSEILMQKLKDGSILFIFIKSYYKKTKLLIKKYNDFRQGKPSLS